MEIVEKKYKNATECPITIFMDKIGGKWKPVIVWLLLKNGTMRFNELDKKMEYLMKKDSLIQPNTLAFRNNLLTKKKKERVKI